MSEHLEVSNMSVLPVTCVGVGTLTLYVLFDAQAQTIPPNHYDVGAYVDGLNAYGYCTAGFQSFTPTVAGVTTFTLNLGGGTHSVDLWSSTNTTRQGAYIVGYAIDAGTISRRSIPTPTRRGLVICDSIDCGCGQNPATQLSVAGLLRPIYPGRLGFIGTGGLALWDMGATGRGNNIGIASMAELAARAVTWLNQDSPIAGIREIWESLGINDALFSGVGRQSSANFGTQCGQFYDAVKTLDPTIRIWAQSPIVSIEGNVNTFGESPPAYRTAKQTAATGRSNVTYVNGFSMMAAGGLGADTLHMSNVGCQGKVMGTGGQQGAISMRGTLGV